jgi:hypothetical protein
VRIYDKNIKKVEKYGKKERIFLFYTTFYDKINKDYIHKTMHGKTLR